MRKRNYGGKPLLSDNNVINKTSCYKRVISTPYLSSRLSALNQTISYRYAIFCNKPQYGMLLAVVSDENLIHGKERKSKRERSVF